MNVNQIKLGATLSYISMGIKYAISIVYTPIMLRLLGQSEFGLYNLVISIVSYLGVLNFGFGSAYMRYYSRYKAKEQKESIAKLNGMFLVIFIIIGLVAVMAGAVLSFNTELIFGSELTNEELYKAKILMIILVINLGISFPNIVFSSYITANEKFVFQKLIDILKSFINPFLVLPLLLMGYGSIGMAIATTVLNIVVEITNLIYSIRKLHMQFSYTNFDFKLMKEVTVFSSYIFINLIIDQVNWNTDKFLIGRFRGTATVAIYGLASQLNNYYLMFSTAISNVFIPRVHRLVATSSNKNLTSFFTRIGRVQFLILSLISTGLLFFGKPFITLWAGPDYGETYLISLLLILPVTIPLIQNIGIEITRAMNLHKFRTWVYLGFAVLNIIISIPLTQKFGGIGAAFGTALALLLGNGILMNWYYHSKVGIDIIYFWKNILHFIPALIIPCVLGILINFRVNLYSISSILIFGSIYIIVFCFSMWLFGMNNYEKDLIGSPILKALKIKQRKTK